MGGLYCSRRLLVFGFFFASHSAFGTDYTYQFFEDPGEFEHATVEAPQGYAWCVGGASYCDQYAASTPAGTAIIWVDSHSYMRFDGGFHTFSSTGTSRSFSAKAWHTINGHSTSGNQTAHLVQYSGYIEPAPEIIPDYSDHDDDCQAIKPTTITLSNKPDGAFSWTYDGCEFTTSAVWLETPYGEWSAVVLGAEAVAVDPGQGDGQVTVPDGYDSSNRWHETTDPNNECPYNNFSVGGTSYCYTGPGAAQGQVYPDDSERVNYWDGSYTINDGQGGSVYYNPDGTLKDPSTAPTGPSQGPGATGTGCPPYAPPWYCQAYHSGDGDGSGSGGGGGGGGSGDGTCEEEDCGLGDGAPDLPVEAIDVEMVDWSSGMSSTAVCPAPIPVVIPFAGMTLEISYEPFCNLAAYLRPLLIAFSYLFAAYLVYRGVV